MFPKIRASLIYRATLGPLVGFMSGISSSDAYGVLHFIYLDSEAEPREFICTRLKSLKPYRMAHLLRFAHIDPVDVAPVLNLLSAGVLDINFLLTGYSFPLLFSTTVNYPHMILADLFGKLLDEIPLHLEPSTFPSESPIPLRYYPHLFTRMLSCQQRWARANLNAIAALKELKEWFPGIEKPNALSWPPHFRHYLMDYVLERKDLLPTPAQFQISLFGPKRDIAWSFLQGVFNNLSI